MKKLTGCVVASLVLCSQLPMLANPAYQQAKEELPSNYYVVYRIIERLARANDLDDLPWRVVVTPNYVVNASASQYNLLTFEAGLIDQFEGNPSALACVVGHEMAHHTKEHLGYGPAKKVDAVARTEMELQQAKEKATQDAQQQSAGGSVLGAIFGGIGAAVGGDAGRALQGTGSAVHQSGQQGLQNLNQTQQEFEQEKLAQLEQRIIEINHNQEFEADNFGYIYSVKAGFEADGCLKAMEILGRGVGSHVDSETHPATKGRSEKLQTLMAEHPPEALKQEGKGKLAINSDPLPYQSFSYQVPDGGTLAGLKISPLKSTEEALENILD